MKNTISVILYCLKSFTPLLRFYILLLPRLFLLLLSLPLLFLSPLLLPLLFCYSSCSSICCSCPFCCCGTCCCFFRRFHSSYCFFWCCCSRCWRFAAVASSAPAPPPPPVYLGFSSRHQGSDKAILTMPMRVLLLSISLFLFFHKITSPLLSPRPRYNPPPRSPIFHLSRFRFLNPHPPPSAFFHPILQSASVILDLN